MLISSTWKPYSKFHNLWPEWALLWFSLCSTQCHLKEGSGRWNCWCLVMTARLLFEGFKQPRKSQAFIVWRDTYYSYLKYVVGCKILLKYRLVSTKRRHDECNFVNFSSISGQNRQNTFDRKEPNSGLQTRNLWMPLPLMCYCGNKIKYIPQLLTHILTAMAPVQAAVLHAWTTVITSSLFYHVPLHYTLSQQPEWLFQNSKSYHAISQMKLKTNARTFPGLRRLWVLLPLFISVIILPSSRGATTLTHSLFPE